MNKFLLTVLLIAAACAQACDEQTDDNSTDTASANVETSVNSGTITDSTSTGQNSDSLSTISTSEPDTQTGESSSSNDLSIPCIEEGASGYVKLLPRCCEGLMEISAAWQPNTDDTSGSDSGQCMADEDYEGVFICAKCGNGECGPGEDFCTCPADCETSTTG
jgi:hypothetical protein